MSSKHLWSFCLGANWISTLGSRQNGRRFVNDILACISLNVLFGFKYHWTFSKVPIAALSHYLTQRWPSLLRHMRPQWFNDLSIESMIKYPPYLWLKFTSSVFCSRANLSTTLWLFFTRVVFPWLISTYLHAAKFTLELFGITSIPVYLNRRECRYGRVITYHLKLWFYLTIIRKTCAVTVIKYPTPDRVCYN